MTAVSVWFKSVIASIFCILGSLVFLTEAVAQTIYPPEMTAIFTFVSHSIRFILPIYIVVLHSTKGVERLNLLSIAIACTFCGHGLQALYEAPPFLDYLLAFFYDINALFNEKLPSNLKIVLLNNHSGGIFEMIAGPDMMGDSLKYQTTPHQHNAEKLAEHFGLGYFKGDTIGSFAQGFDLLKASDKAFILEIQTDAESNKKFFDLFKGL